ncbi:unnamed protein product [Camellia sinensis]
MWHCGKALGFKPQGHKFNSPPWANLLGEALLVRRLDLKDA